MSGKVLVKYSGPVFLPAGVFSNILDRLVSIESPWGARDAKDREPSESQKIITMCVH